MWLHSPFGTRRNHSLARVNEWTPCSRSRRWQAVDLEPRESQPGCLLPSQSLFSPHCHWCAVVHGCSFPPGDRRTLEKDELLSDLVGWAQHWLWREWLKGIWRRGRLLAGQEETSVHCLHKQAETPYYSEKPHVRDIFIMFSFYFSHTCIHSTYACRVYLRCSRHWVHWCEGYETRQDSFPWGSHCRQGKRQDPK